MAHLSTTLLINAPVDTVNQLVKDTGNWGKWWVGMEGPDRVFGDGGQGTKAEYKLLMMGVRMHMTQRTIEERHEPDGSTYWRWEFEGPTSGWITCYHKAQGDACQINTDMEYSLPGSVLGKVADRLLIEKRQKRDFENSLENLKLLAEASAKAEVNV